MRTVLLLAALLVGGACHSPSPEPHAAAPLRVVGWKPLASWTGRGDLQTETFLSDTGSFRIRWEATNESPEGGGSLKVAFRSGDSGRVIIDAVNQRGAGRGMSEVGDMVRWYYLTIESANVDWSVAVEEPLVDSR